MYHHLRHAIGRHGGFGGGFGRKFGRGFQDGHGDNFPSGRKLSADELQLVILALLAESPAHGYEIIRRLEEHSSGFYKPSPGMVYPALTYLEEIGQTAVTQEGTRKLYTLTKEGKIRLQTDREQVDVLLEILRRIGKRMADAREAFAGLHDADPQAADSLHKARHALKSVLYRCRGCTSSEARRIADILNRAAAEILEKPEQ